MKTSLLSLLSFAFIFFTAERMSAQEIWGMTKYGGTYEKGVIFKMDEDASSQEAVFSFEVIGIPEGGLTEYSENVFYGMTTYGGGNGYGAIYRFEAVKGSFLKVADFNGEDNGRDGHGKILRSSNGMLYGLTARGGVHDAGVLFELNPSSGTVTKIIDFDGKSKGSEPLGSLVEASDGNLYGMTSLGGAYEAGVVFSYNLMTGDFKKVFDFDGDEFGSNPMGSLMQASNGMLYGMTRWGGANDHGVIFRYNPGNEQLEVVFEFDGQHTGRFPHGSLTEASNGKLYGLTPYGGIFNMGVIFEYDPAIDVFNLKYEFTGGVGSGASPFGSMKLADNGKLYGIIQEYGYETELMFEFDPLTGSYHKVDVPLVVPREYRSLMESVSLSSDGRLYFIVNGNTNDIKNINYLYEYDVADEKFTDVHTFSGVTTGDFPYGSLYHASNGKLYGTTYSGGMYDDGVIFEYDPVLLRFRKHFDFSSESQGGSPQGGLTEASDLKLYGMTSEGGVHGMGTIYSYDPGTGNYSVLLSFNGNNGKKPDGDFVKAADGNLYGTTSRGGNHDEGVLFMLEPSTGNFIKLIDFKSGEFGSNPGSNSLVAASNGNLYGTTSSGGAGNRGILFEYNPQTNDYAAVAHYDPLVSGRAIDLCDGHGNYLYSSNGYRFSLTDKTYEQFIYENDVMFYIAGRLLAASNGKLYGMDGGEIWYRATESMGGIYQFDEESGKAAVIHEFTGKNGANPVNSALIQLRSTTAPVAECRDIVIYTDENGHAELVPSDVFTGVIQTGMQLSVSKSEFSCADIGENTVVLTVSGSSGSTSACNSIVTVADTIAPVAICRDVIVYLDESGNATLDAESLDGGSSDACGIDVMVADIAEFSAADIGENAVELKVVDVSGNSSVCVATVTVIDNLPPEIACAPAKELYVLPGEGFYLVNGNELDATATDNSSIETLLAVVNGDETVMYESLYGIGLPEGTHSIVWVASDAGGNSAECAVTVTVGRRPAVINCFTENEENSGDLIIVAELKDELTGYGIGGKTLQFVVNNVTGTAVTDENGVALYRLELEAGSFPVIVSFEGDSCYLEVSYSSNVVTSVRQGSMLSKMDVYPNPFMQRLNIEFVPVTAGRAVLGMFDSSGRLVEIIFDRTVENGMLYRAVFIPSGRAGSHYYYKLTIDGATESGKVIHGR